MISLHNIVQAGREAVQHVQSAAETVNRTVTRSLDASQRVAEPLRPAPQLERAAQVALHRVAEIVGAGSQDPEALATPVASIPQVCLPPDKVAELARSYAPVYYLHPEENYQPSDPGAFIRESSLRVFDKEVIADGRVSPSTLPGVEEKNLAYLDHDDSEAARAGDADTAPIMYQYDQAKGKLTYWTFYAYNDKDYHGVFSQRHEGDWERVTVQLDGNLRAREVLYSNHDNEPRQRSWAEAPTENGHPVVYVARGSHANSYRTGDQHVEVDGPDIPLFIGPARVGSIDTAPDTEDEFARGEVRIDSRDRLADVTAQPWYGTQVNWGQRGQFDFTSGPVGPSSEKSGLSR